MLPKEYAWLQREPGPAMLREALALFGTHEIPGAANNPVIMEWAKEVGLANVYKDDSGQAWCGLLVSICAKRAGWAFAPNGNPLWALNWAKWEDPSPLPALGDVLVFKRKLPNGGTAGHVGIYVAEDAAAFHVLGGNQGDAVSICRVERSRLVAGRRPHWKVREPSNIRRVKVAVNGSLSTNEA